jgi:hypothetical protein
MRITSAGNVGIGTNSPSFPLDVSSTGVGSAIVSRFHVTDSTIGLLRVGNSTSGNAATAPSFGSNGNDAVIHTNNAERMRIDSAGKLLSPGGAAFVGTVATGATNGAIIQRGSNANGDFVRYADGTMICTGVITESRSATGVLQTNWTMPSTFVGVLDYVPAAHPATSRPDLVIGTTPLRTSSSVVEVYVNRTNTTSTTVYVSAIGKWF